MLETAIRVRLGKPVPRIAHGPETCRHHTRGGCTTSHQVDGFGEHDHVCSRSGRIRRHNRVQRAVQKLLDIAGIHQTLCTIDCLRFDDDETSRKRPDIRINFPDQLAPVLVDVAVAHPLAVTYQNNYTERGSTTNARAKDKLAESIYVARATILGHEIEAFAVETFGGWGEDARSVLRHITKVAVSKGTRRHGGWLPEAMRQRVPTAGGHSFGRAPLRPRRAWRCFPQLWGGVPFAC